MLQGLRVVCAVLLFLLASACQPESGNAASHGAVSQSQSDSPASGSMPLIEFAQLPPEAHDTLSAIRQGGPFAYQRDGVVFGNREHILPAQPRGYYHEYTVKTPGVHHRGARRIVCGIAPECYYTADHYNSFSRIQR